MKPADWFLVGLRLLGAWWFVQGLGYVMVFADVRLGFTIPPGDPHALPHGNLLYAAGYLGIAAYCFIGGESLARRFFK